MGRSPRVGALGLVLLASLLAGCTLRAPSAAPELAAPGLYGEAGPPAGVDDGRYRVFLPPGFPEAAPYPVIYFLHDFFGDSAILWRRGVMAELEAAMAAGEVPPVVIVAPEGDQGFWSDYHDGSRRYETWVTGALRERVEATYPVRSDPAGRAITGISMGGYGAVKAALRRPGLYGEAGSLSGALIPYTWGSVQAAPFFLELALERVFGDGPEDNALADNHLVNLLERHAADVDELPPLHLRSGTEDDYDLDEAARRFAAAAEAAGWPVVLELEPGEHEWAYWERSAVEMLAGHARRLGAAPAPETAPSGGAP